MADENKGTVMSPAGLRPAEFLFGKKDEKTGRVEFSGTHNIFASAAAPPTQNRNTGVECPLCRSQGVLQNPVMSNQDGLLCNMGHKYKDTEDLLSRPHDTVPVAMPKTVQENYVTLPVQLPSSAVQALQNRYAGDVDKMKATIASIVQQLGEGNIIVVGEQDLKLMGDVCGQPIRTAKELYGILVGLRKMIDDYKEAASGQDGEAQRPAGGTALRRGELILWFSPPNTQALQERAGSNNLRMEDFLEQFIGQAIENNWF